MPATTLEGTYSLYSYSYSGVLSSRFRVVCTVSEGKRATPENKTLFQYLRTYVVLFAYKGCEVTAATATSNLNSLCAAVRRPGWHPSSKNTPTYYYVLRSTTCTAYLPSTSRPDRQNTRTFPPTGLGVYSSLLYPRHGYHLPAGAFALDFSRALTQNDAMMTRNCTHNSVYTYVILITYIYTTAGGTTPARATSD